MPRSLKSFLSSSSGLVFGLTLGLTATLSLALGGCASGGMLRNLPPAIGGEPADLPAAPKTPYKYPAVHDMPPPRATKPLSDNEQIRLEKELEAARDSQQNKYRSASEPVKKPAPAAKGKAAKHKAEQGAKNNEVKGDGINGAGAKTNP